MLQNKHLLCCDRDGWGSILAATKRSVERTLYSVGESHRVPKQNRVLLLLMSNAFPEKTHRHAGSSGKDALPCHQSLEKDRSGHKDDGWACEGTECELSQRA